MADIHARAMARRRMAADHATSRAMAVLIVRRATVEVPTALRAEVAIAPSVAAEAVGTSAAVVAVAVPPTPAEVAAEATQAADVVSQR